MDRGWRLRLVDDLTESLVNGATGAKMKIRSQGLDVLRLMILLMSLLGFDVTVWKGDIASAFRLLMYAPAHWQFFAVAYLIGGEAMYSCHRTLCFGGVSSVFGWHRAAGYLLCVLVRKAKCIAAKYVDDYFGVRKRGCNICTADILHTICFVSGLHLDDKKTKQLEQAMVISGCNVVLNWAWKGFHLYVDEQKAVKWLKVIVHFLEKGRMTSAEASQMAGRLGWSTQAVHDRCGRAFIRQLYAQINAPLKGDYISMRLRRALRFWRWFLVAQRKTCHSVRDLRRPHIDVWGDASGEKKTLGLVVDSHAGLFWTTYTIPNSVMHQCLPRRNHGINVQELLAIPLLLGIFESLLKGSLVSYIGDADGVNGAFLAGASHKGAEDMNLIIGRCWLELACL